MSDEPVIGHVGWSPDYKTPRKGIQNLPLSDADKLKLGQELSDWTRRKPVEQDEDKPMTKEDTRPHEVCIWIREIQEAIANTATRTQEFLADDPRGDEVLIRLRAAQNELEGARNTLRPCRHCESFDKCQELGVTGG